MNMKHSKNKNTKELNQKKCCICGIREHTVGYFKNNRFAYNPNQSHKNISSALRRVEELKLKYGRKYISIKLTTKNLKHYCNKCLNSVFDIQIQKEKLTKKGIIEGYSGCLITGDKLTIYEPKRKFNHNIPYFEVKENLSNFVTIDKMQRELNFEKSELLELIEAAYGRN